MPLEYLKPGISRFCCLAVLNEETIEYFARDVAGRNNMSLYPASFWHRSVISGRETRGVIVIVMRVRGIPQVGTGGRTEGATNGQFSPLKSFYNPPPKSHFRSFALISDMLLFTHTSKSVTIYWYGVTVYTLLQSTVWWEGCFCFCAHSIWQQIPYKSLWHKFSG